MAKKKKHYFTIEHENAIKKYSQTDDVKERSELYVQYIEPVFSELVDKIIFTYKFITLPNIDTLREECKIWLITVLDKYDASKGTKAFSYFSVIVKNWFVHQVKKNNKRVQKEVSYEEIASEYEYQHILASQNSYQTFREEKEFWNFLLFEIDTWDQKSFRVNEKKVIKAVKILLESVDDIEIYSKKSIYLYLREITNLNTKQIVSVLNRIRIQYRFFKNKWNDGKI